MNLEDYVNHIKQKYKLFIALTILKTKPDNESIENYINILRNKLENEIDLNSICSDDFLFNDEIMPNIQNYNNDTQAFNIGDVTADAQCFPSLERNYIQKIHTITKERKSDMNQRYNIQNDQVSTKLPDFSNNVQGDKNDTIAFNNSQNDKDDNILQDRFAQCQGLKDQDNDISHRDLKTEELKSNTQISNNSVDLLQDYLYFNNGTKQDKKHDPAIYEILREVDDEIQDTQLFNTDKTFCESQRDVEMANAISQTLITQDNAKPNMIDTIDSQQTELYSVHGFTQNYTYISQSQTQNVNMPQKYIYGSKTNNLGNKENPLIFKNNTVLTDEDLTMINEYDIFTQSQHCNENKSNIINTNINNVASTRDYKAATKTDHDIDKEDKKNSNIDKCNPINDITEPERSKDYYMRDIIEANLFKEDNANHITKNFDSIKMTNDLDTNKNHIEVAKIETHEVLRSNEKDIQANSSNNINEHDKQNNSIQEIFKYDVDAFTTKNYFENMNVIPQNVIINTDKATMQYEANGKSQDDYNAINNTICKFNKAHIDLENDFNIENKTSQNNFNINNSTTSENEFTTENIVTKNDFNFENNTTQNDKNETYVRNMEEDVINVNTQNDMNVSDDERNQIVPFKIIDELNRVKSYFNRKVEIRQSRDGLIDSGYRSDTQGRYSKSSSQLSITSLNQSAHCLLNFLTNYPLLPQTNEITNDISMVLGNLLDSLHEEENYLPFLEELLDCISSLLKRLHQEDNEDNMLLKKEELSQRIMFLNKSVHIQKFTIEKIANILDETHTELIKKDAKREIENISAIENLCYVFNILQVLLPKFLEHGESPRQNKEGVLTRSSLTDIWRMRWGGEIKIKSSEQNEEKCNVVEKLSEILNKLIVDCMDGCSLIAYFSLKCFNLLQSHK